MSELVCTLRRLLARLSRPDRVLGDGRVGRPPGRHRRAGGVPAARRRAGAGDPATVARELEVRQPAALTLAVLAAAPRLASVVLPAHGRLPATVRAELDRRQIALVWRQPGLRPVGPRPASGTAALAAVGCPVNRRGPGS